jgi:hypothetical protein
VSNADGAVVGWNQSQQADETLRHPLQAMLMKHAQGGA